MLKAKSAYHFDNWRMDPRWDNIVGLGRFVGNWSNELAEIKETAKPVSWRNRSETGLPNKHVDKEEYDLQQAGMDPNSIISSFEYNLPPLFKKMCDMIGLENRQDRVHVQWPGQVFSKHIDKLEKMNPSNPDKIMRVMIMLSDWEPGHFNQFGNYTYTQWRAGDIHTFDWKNVPHSSANASLVPRFSLLTTGTITDTTIEFIKRANQVSEIQINDSL